MCILYANYENIEFGGRLNVNRTMKIFNAILALGITVCALIIGIGVLNGVTGCSRKSKQLPTGASLSSVKKKSNVMIDGRCLDYICFNNVYYYYPCGCGVRSDCPEGGGAIVYGDVGIDGNKCEVVRTSLNELSEDATPTPIPSVTPYPSATPTPDKTATPTPGPTCVLFPKETEMGDSIKVSLGEKSKQLVNRVLSKLPFILEIKDVAVFFKGTVSDCCLENVNQEKGVADAKGGLNFKLHADRIPLGQAASVSHCVPLNASQCYEVLLSAGAFGRMDCSTQVSAGHKKNICEGLDCYYGEFYFGFEPAVDLTLSASACVLNNNGKRSGCSEVTLTPLGAKTSVSLRSKWNNDCDGRLKGYIDAKRLMGYFHFTAGKKGDPLYIDVDREWKLVSGWSLPIDEEYN
jgi:hypothetical protein